MEKLRAGVLVKLLISYREKYVFDRANGKYQVKLRNQKMKLYRLSVIIVLFSFGIANARIIQNGDFESWTNFWPDNWEQLSPDAPVASIQVTGLDGSGSAVQLGLTASSSSISSLRQGLSQAFSDSFYFQFDFSYEDPGSIRGINAILRGGGEAINCRVQDNSFEIYNSSPKGWNRIVGTDGQLVPSTKVYRATIQGTWGANYTFTLENMTDGLDMVTNVNAGFWQSTSPTWEVVLSRGSSGADWTCDNVIVLERDPSIPFVGDMTTQFLKWPENTVTMAPVVIDEDTPEENLTYLWTKLSGPSISFSTNPGETENDKNAVVTFSSVDEYELKLTVTDPCNVGEGTVRIKVKDASDEVLLGRWDFEDNSAGTTAVDTIGAAGNNVADDGALGNKGGPGPDPNFVSNGWVNTQALQFYEPSIVEIAVNENNTDPNMNNLQWEFTACAWVKADPDNTSTYNSIINRVDPFIWTLRQRGNGNIQFVIALESGNVSNSGNISILDDYWHHVVGVYDGKELAIYVDGVLDNTIEASGLMNVDYGSSMSIGNRINSNHPWDGLLDDVRVYSYALPYDDGEHSVVGLGQLGKNAIPYVVIDDDHVDTEGTSSEDPLMYTTFASTNLYAAVGDVNGDLAGPLWTVVFEPAPGDVSFGDASSANTSVNFRQAGTYVLQLEVWDDYGAGAESDIYDRITIYVEAPSCEDLLLTAQNGVVSNPYLAADISGPLGMPDCSVDLYDIAAMSREWLKCVDPKDTNCVNPFE